MPHFFFFTQPMGSKAGRETEERIRASGLAFELVPAGGRFLAGATEQPELSGDGGSARPIAVSGDRFGHPALARPVASSGQ